jgi:nitrous oxidase accessory protein NosD
MLPLVMLALLISGGGEETSECTITILPGLSIQEVIDGAGEGDVLCLMEGRWVESLRIEKPLTLRGLGVSQTFIEGRAEGFPVVWIDSTIQTPSIRLERLTITGAHGECADEEAGICSAGVLIQGAPQVELTEVNITWNVYGIGLMGSARLVMRNSSISRSWMEGLALRGFVQAELNYSSITDGLGGGLRVEDSAWADLTFSAVSGNKAHGIVVGDRALLEITKSIIHGNGKDGILLSDSARASLRGNRILRNWGYGVALLSPCYETEGVFSGDLSGGANVIPGPGEPDMNGRGAVCPEELEFLVSERGGKYP